MQTLEPKPRVFISHSAKDTWLARQIASHIQRGAETFLDSDNLHFGDDFEDKILEAARDSTELLVLLTPWSVNRPYIWMEVGLFWGNRRMIGVLYGIEPKELATDERMPIALKKLDLVDLNGIDSYFSQLKARVWSWSKNV